MRINAMKYFLCSLFAATATLSHAQFDKNKTFYNRADGKVTVVDPDKNFFGQTEYNIRHYNSPTDAFQAEYSTELALAELGVRLLIEVGSAANKWWNEKPAPPTQPATSQQTESKKGETFFGLPLVSSPPSTQSKSDIDKTIDAVAGQVSDTWNSESRDNNAANKWLSERKQMSVQEQQTAAANQIDAVFGSKAAFENLVQSELGAAVRDGRAYAARGNKVALLGIQVSNMLQKLDDGMIYYVAIVRESDNPAILKDDMIFACDGVLLRPGYDLTALINSSPNVFARHSISVARKGTSFDLGLVPKEAVGDINSIEARRMSDAVEAVYTNALLRKAKINNMAWVKK